TQRIHSRPGHRPFHINHTRLRYIDYRTVAEPDIRCFNTATDQIIETDDEVTSHPFPVLAIYDQIIHIDRGTGPFSQSSRHCQYFQYTHAARGRIYPGFFYRSEHGDTLASKFLDQYTALRVLQIRFAITVGDQLTGRCHRLATDRHITNQ